MDDTRTVADLVLETVPLTGTPWPTIDPFLFCVHHDDAYPAGQRAARPRARRSPAANIGQDFAGNDGWRMYHGDDGAGLSRSIRTAASRP